MQNKNTGTLISARMEDFSLREMAAPIFRRKKILIVTLLCSFVLFTAIGLLIFYKFKSQMAILVNRERADSVVTIGTPNQTITEPVPVSEEEINSEAELLLSRDLLEKVVIENHLQDQEPSFLDRFLPKQDEARRIANEVEILAHKIKVRPSTKANIINVSYSSRDAQTSYAVLTSLANLYMEKHAAVHRPPGSYDFFSAETAKYKKALDDSESRLRSFVRTTGGAAPDLERADLDLQLAGSIAQYHTTQQDIAADERRVANDLEQMKSTPQRSATQVSSSPADLLLQQLGASLLAVETKRTQLLMKYDANYPLVQEADQELALARSAFEKAQSTKYVTENTNADATYELLREDLAKSQSDLAAQRARLAANKASIDSMQSQMVRIAEAGLDQSDLLRDQKANEENFLLYLSKREQERTSDALDKTRIENVAIATPPSIPVLPILSPAMVILLALIAALLVSTAWIYLMDYMDSSFHTPAQVIDIMGIPVVIAVSKKTA
jgi:uncharacterized protein involved in exopolysaccharide biosynthesis